jgi:hypothetical protein
VAEVVVRLERREATALGAFVDSFVSLAADDPRLAEARPYLARAKGALAAALDSPPVERIEYRVAAENFETESIRTGKWINEREARDIAFARAEGCCRGGMKNVRVQSREVTTFSDGSELIGPWVDLEEGEQGG